jgi:hypothetical protein
VSSLEADAPRELVVYVLQRIAAFAGAPIRDVFEDEVIEVWPNGDVKQLEGELAESITSVIDRGGSSSYRTFEYLEGFDIAVPGEFEGAFLDDLPGENEFEVQPLRALRERLDELIANDEIKEYSVELHRSLREMCDVAEKLQLPLVTGV